jgi:hypothetical protein
MKYVQQMSSTLPENENEVIVSLLQCLPASGWLNMEMLSCAVLSILRSLAGYFNCTGLSVCLCTRR